MNHALKIFLGWFAIIAAVVVGVGFVPQSLPPGWKPAELVERPPAPKYKPFSVLCDGGGNWVTTVGDGTINPYHVFRSYEDAKADADWRRAGQPRGGAQLALVHQVLIHDWHPCEHDK